MEQLQRPPHIWGNICAFPHILGGLPQIGRCNCSNLNFLIYEENLISFFISVPAYVAWMKLKRGLVLWISPRVLAFITETLSSRHPPEYASYEGQFYFYVTSCCSDNGERATVSICGIRSTAHRHDTSGTPSSHHRK
jgi:hypothetical protein